MSDDVLGLMNVLVEQSNADTLHRCAMMEMVNYVNYDREEPDGYGIDTVYAVCGELKISREAVDGIDAVIKQRLGSDTKIEHFIHGDTACAAYADSR